MNFLTKIPFLFISIVSASTFASEPNIINEAEALAVDAKFYAASYNVT